MPTKDELEAQLSESEEMEKELQAKIRELQEQNERLAADMAAMANAGKQGRGGWIVTTPNPEYFGQHGPVRFQNGKAFVPGEPAEPTEKVTPAQVFDGQQRSPERRYMDKFHGAPDIIRDFVSRFGYEVEYKTAAEVAEILDQSEQVQDAVASTSAGLITPSYIQG